MLDLRGLPRTFWVLWTGALINRLGGFVLPLLAFYLTGERGLSVQQVGLVISLFGAGVLCAGPVGGFLSDHLGRRRTLILALVLGAFAMLHLAFAAGLRVSELVGLRLDEVALQPQPTIHVMGKGRRERLLPLWKTTAKALRAWLAVRGAASCPEFFINARGGPLTRDGFEYILAKHLATATVKTPSLEQKRVSPHVLRHSCAMHTLAATHDIRKVALWLGHATVQTTEIYLRADPSAKIEALDAVLPSGLRRGRFRAPDKLLASLRPARKAS